MARNKAADRYIGKVKQYDTKYGQAQKIYLDNPNPSNPDGTPNTFYKGTLVWIDAETGKTFQIKQLGIMVPKDGMKPDLLQKGFTCNITVNIEDEYEVTPLD